MYRPDKVAKAIKREVSNIIQVELKDPRIGFVTVTNVEITSDLRFAKIYFSTLGTRQEEKKNLDVLNCASGYIKRLIAQRIKLRFIPEIVFKVDRSAEYSIHIQEELDKIHEQKERELNEFKKSKRGNKKK